MAIFKVVLPKLGWTMEKGKLLAWFFAEGDQVEKGVELYEVDTDKVSIKVEAPTSGILRKILAPVGAIVPVNDVIALLGEEGDDIDPILEEIEQARKKQPAMTTIPAVESTSRVGGSSIRTPGGKVLASPRAKKLARELNIDLTLVTGTFQDGKIVERDVLNFMKNQGGRSLTPPVSLHPSLTITQAQPMESIRKVIADRMYYSLQSMAQLTISMDVDMSTMAKFRATYNQKYAPRASYTDFLTLITSEVLKNYSELHASISPDGQVINYLEEINIGIATATDRGLMVPVVKQASQMTLGGISKAIKQFAAQARANAIPLDDLSGGTFTITNLGMYGIDVFTPIINPPETAILGVGRIVEKPVVINGGIQARPMMVLSLSFDHRLIDGHRGAEFLQELKQHLENPREIQKMVESRGFEAKKREFLQESLEKVDYDFIIVGCGPGGQAAAEKAVELGARVLIIEGDLLGGKCLNWGCVPTKFMAQTLDIKTRLEQASNRQFGISASEVKTNFAQIVTHKTELVTKLRDGLARTFEGKGIEVIAGFGKITGAHEVQVGDQTHTGKVILIATGESYLPLAGQVKNGHLVVDPRKFLDLTKLPDQVTIYGADFIAFEIALICFELEKEIKILVPGESILPLFDQELVGYFEEELEMRGIDIVKNVQDLQIIKGKIQYSVGGSDPTIEDVELLVNCAHLAPHLEKSIDLEAIPLELENHHVKTNEFGQTSVPSIFAIGDITTNPNKLSHKASEEGRVAVEHALGNTRKVNYQSIPRAIFSRPSLAAVGWTEAELSARGIPYSILRIPMAMNTMAHIEGQIEGIMKILYDPKSTQLLGVHLLGPEAYNLINSFALAVTKSVSLSEIRNLIPIHPTYGELFKELKEA